jgi:hypothetical protein
MLWRFARERPEAPLVPLRFPPQAGLFFFYRLCRLSHTLFDGGDSMLVILDT